jgi:predicted nucleotidyltransferase
MVAVLLVRELKHLQKNFPQRGFLHWYPIMRREAGALNACASIVSVSVYVQVKTIPRRKIVLQILITHVFLIEIDY